jgi:hypothetical protein
LIEDHLPVSERAAWNVQPDDSVGAGRLPAMPCIAHQLTPRGWGGGPISHNESNAPKERAMLFMECY